MNGKPIQLVIALVLGLTVGYRTVAEDIVEADKAKKAAPKKPVKKKPVKKKPAPPKYTGHLEPGEWKLAWTDALELSLTTSNLLTHQEKQIEALCPGYDADPDGKRHLFWKQLMISLSYKESMHGPDNWVNFNKGVNDGLFQINPKLRDAYECGDINLFDPLANIGCAVRMAAKLVTQFGSFLDGSKGGMAAYWQPLRSTTTLNTKNRKYILAAVTKACATGALDFESTDAPSFVQDGVTYNDTDDLGLSEAQLNGHDADYSRAPATFEFDPQSGMMFDFSGGAQ